jgi:subtilase family serine protease
LNRSVIIRSLALSAALAAFGAALAQDNYVPAPGAPKIANAPKSPLQISPTTSIRIGIGLAGFQQSAAEEFVASQYDPKSPNYHQWIPTYEFGEKFGAPQSDIGAVESYLARYGFTEFNVGQSGNYLTAKGTFAGAAKAFNMTIGNYVRPAELVQKGEPATFYAPATAVELPASIAPKVQGVFGLANLALGHPSILHTRTKHGASSFKKQGVSYLPAQLASAYLGSDYQNAGFNGQDEKIAVFSPTGRDVSDVTTFATDLKISGFTIFDVFIQGGPSDSSGYEEASLDLETIIGQAHDAIIFAMEPPVGSSDAAYMPGELDGYDAVGIIGDIPVLSSSWDLEEADVISEGDQSYATSFSNVCMALASSGVSIFNSSGDAGAYSNTGSKVITTKLETCCPFLTSVGGTTLTLNSSNAWLSETLWKWNGSTTSPEGGGGGISQLYKQPTWQTGPGVTTSASTGFREEPDVAAVADPNTGYEIIAGGEAAAIGGTSGATPLWAGTFLDILSYYQYYTKTPVFLGLINPALYQTGTDFETAATDATGSLFAYHDITSGSNGKYSCTTSYDFCAGWGSCNFLKLGRDIGYIYKIPNLVPDYVPFNPHSTTAAWTNPVTISSSSTAVSEPATFTTADTYDLEVAQSNTGLSDAPPSSYTISIDGKVVFTGSEPAIALGVPVLSTNVYSTKFTAGTHTILLTVNSGGLLEKATTNNTFSRTITVG